MSYNCYFQTVKFNMILHGVNFEFIFDATTCSRNMRLNIPTLRLIDKKFGMSVEGGKTPLFEV